MGSALVCTREFSSIHPQPTVATLAAVDSNNAYSALRITVAATTCRPNTVAHAAISSVLCRRDQHELARDSFIGFDNHRHAGAVVVWRKPGVDREQSG